jgi:hypothetical protein
VANNDPNPNLPPTPGPPPGPAPGPAPHRPVWQIAAAVIAALGAITAAVIGAKMSGNDKGKDPDPPRTSESLTASTPPPPQAWKDGGEVFLNVPARPYDLDSPWVHADGRYADIQVAGPGRDQLVTLNGAVMVVITSGGKPSVEKCRTQLEDNEMQSATIVLGQFYCIRTNEKNTALVQVKRRQLDNNGIPQIVAEGSFAEG